MARFLDIDKQPTKSHFYMWADYIEMLCLTQPDGEITKADVLDRYRDKLATRSRSRIGETLAEEFDSQEGKVNDWFQHIDFRHNRFKEAYPFSLSADKSILKRKRHITEKQKLYIYLLAAANLRWFRKTIENSLTNSFEEISTLVLKKYLANSGKSYLFGSNPLNKGRYSGTLWKKIEAFSRDILEKPAFEEKDFDPRNSGDHGLDIVGWIPFLDNTQGFAVFLGQCACGEKWVDKQLTSSSARWGKVINFSLPPNNVAFIPICFRDSNGSWYDKTKIDQDILIDRVRIVDLIKEDISSLPSSWPAYIVDKILQQKDGIV